MNSWLNSLFSQLSDQQLISPEREYNNRLMNSWLASLFSQLSSRINSWPADQPGDRIFCNSIIRVLIPYCSTYSGNCRLYSVMIDLFYLHQAFCCHYRSNLWAYKFLENSLNLQFLRTMSSLFSMNRMTSTAATSSGLNY